jgi:peptidyl-prolyl cis-trans isomerase B (cyclophilin B)
MNVSGQGGCPVPSNEQRRQAAKRKLERQLARRAERAKRRRIWGVSATVFVVVLVAVGVYVLVNLGPDDPDAAANPTTDTETPAGETTEGACKYAESSGEEMSAAGMPNDPAETPSTGTVKVTVTTNQGAIPLTLDRAQAPCTVQSIEHLVSAKFYDGVNCHRLTAGAGLKVLQCGDPNGDGSGGPGYTIPDEPPTTLAAGPDGQTSIYPRGVIAMAKTQEPNSGGSQFFLVYGDSTLPPDYTVFGTIDPAGLTVLDTIAAGGVAPGGSPEDGAPAIATTIESAALA